MLTYHDVSEKTCSRWITPLEQAHSQRNIRKKTKNDNERG